MYCPNCGSQIPDGSSFCPVCGARIRAVDPLNPEVNNYQYPSVPNGTERNIALCIVFTIITCGIYGLYWMIKLNNEINKLSDNRNATSGGMVILFEIITCNIYGWYWCYKMGQRTNMIKAKMGENQSSEFVYVIFAIFGLNMVSYALMQDTINEAVRAGL